jgi:hypothetical protein
MSDTPDRSFSINQSHLSQSNVAAYNQVSGDLIQHQTTNHYAGVPLTETLQQLLYHHESATIFVNCLSTFVGREDEIAEIRERIAQIRPTGGYVTITAQAGEGKSSVIAQMVSQDGPDQTAFHFIALPLGREYQLSLLRPIVARLILKHGLSTTYFPGESYPAMRDYFHSVLRQLSERGIQDVIYIDGLDQLEADASGARDLSFLPNSPPPGIVLVLGTRPDDTLHPLESKKVQVEYRLPHLSYLDFQHLLSQRGVVTPAAQRVYAALQGNAFYLALVVQELKAGPIADLDAFIQQISDNPENLFGLTFQRLRQDRTFWREILQPILTLLLVTQEPLGIAVIRHLLDAEDDVRTGLQRLGGLVAQDSQGRSFLYHLKVREYLAENEQDPDKPCVVNQKQIQAWHKRLAAWCVHDSEDMVGMWEDITGLEQTRRVYARYHYVTHLALGQQWDRLCQVIDDGIYGRYKRRFDPSTQLYAQDLDRARDAAVATDDLHRLWRWSLLRVSLTSQIDSWPNALFLALVHLGRGSEALSRVELTADPHRRFNVLCQLAPLFPEGKAEIVWQRALDTLQGLRDDEKRPSEIIALCKLSESLITAGKFAQVWSVAQALPDDSSRAEVLTDLVWALITAHELAQARAVAETLPDGWWRASALSRLAAAMITAQHPDAGVVLAQTSEAAAAVPNEWVRRRIFDDLIRALITAHELAQVWAVAETLPDEWCRASALIRLATAMIATEHPDAAAVFDQARHMAMAVPDDGERTEVLINLVDALITAHEFTQARTVAAAVPDDGERTKVLINLVDALITAHELAHALAVAETLPHPWIRAGVLSLMAQAMVTAQLPGADAIFVQVRTMAEHLPDKWEQGMVLGLLAQAMAIAQHPDAADIFEQAHNAAAAVLDDERKSIVLINLVDALITAHKFAQARTVAAAVPDEWERAQIFRQLAEAMVAAQHSDVAVVFEQAHNAAAAVPDAERRAKALTDLVDVLITAHEFTQACVTAEAVPDTKRQAKAFIRLTEAMVTAQHPDAAVIFVRAWTMAERDDRPEVLATLRADGDFTQVRAVAAAIQDAEIRVEVLSCLAEAMVTAQHPDAAAVLMQAWETTKALPNDRMHAFARIRLAKTMTLTQHPEAAAVFEQIRAMAAVLPDYSWEQAEVLWLLSEALITVGDLRQARVVAEDLPDDYGRPEVLATLSTALIAAGEFAEARAAAAAVPYERRRAEALSEVAQAMAATQHPDAATVFVQVRAVAEALRDDAQWVAVLKPLSAVLIMVGHFAQARAVAEAIPDDATRTEVLETLCGSLITAGEFAEAWVVAVMVPDAWRRTVALSQLSQAMFIARHRDSAAVFAEARAVAKELPPWRRAEALRWQPQVRSGLARTLVTAQEMVTAQHLDAADIFAQVQAVTKTHPSNWEWEGTLGRLFLLCTRTNDANSYTRIYQDICLKWSRARSWEELLSLSPLAAPLIARDQGFGHAFIESFAWVDDQLRER